MLDALIAQHDFEASHGGQVYTTRGELQAIRGQFVALINADLAYSSALTALRDLNRRIAEQGWLALEHDALRNACHVLVRAEIARTDALAVLTPADAAANPCPHPGCQLNDGNPCAYSHCPMREPSP